MALLTGPRNTSCLGDAKSFKAYPIEANTTLYLGGMVAIDANGYLVPAQEQASSGNFTTLVVVGMSNDVVGGIPCPAAINVAGANMIPNPPNLGAAGALWMNVLQGTLLWDNDASNPVAQTNVGDLVFATSDRTVGTTYGSSPYYPVAGRVVEITAAGQVWVDMTQKSLTAIISGTPPVH